MRQSRTLFVNNGALQAQIAAREADLARAQSDLARAEEDVARRAPLVASGAVGKEEFNHVTAQVAVAKTALSAAESGAQAAREQLASNQSLTEGISVEQHPAVLQAAARVREAHLALARAELVAPVDGYVARRSVQIGQRVQAGTPLLSVIALKDVWVDANFKEGQLRNLRIGQPVELVADVYGKKVEYHGTDRRPGRRHRRRLRPAAGAERHRQLDQGGAARAGADRPRPEGSGRASAAHRPVDGRQGGRRQHRRPDARRRARAPARRSKTAIFDEARPRPRPTCSASSPPISAGRSPRSRAGAAAGTRRRRSSARRWPAPRPPPPPTDERARRHRAGRSGAACRRIAGAAAPAAAAAAAPPPLTGGALVLGTIALSLATFMNVLDTSIANVSIPAISGDLGVSPSQGTWVITSFAVANAISVPLTGWLTQRFGPVRLFVMSILLFVIASWLCGLAPNIGMLIAFRVLQGFVAGPMIPLSQTLLLSSYPRAKAGTAMAMWAMTVLVAPVAGPLLGGWITDNISWPWIFYINIPVGLAAAAITWSIYRSRDPGPRKTKLDYVGLGLLIVWVGALADHGRQGQGARLVQLDRDRRPRRHRGDRLRLLPRLGADREAPGGRPAPVRPAQLPDGHARRSRSPTASSSATSCCCRSGCSSTWATPRPGPAWRPRRSASWRSCSRPGSARTSSKIDPRKLATVAFIGFGFVLWMRSHFNTLADFETILLPTVLQGAAMAFFFIPLQAVIFSGLTPDRMPAAAGLSNFVRITAGAIGTSIFTTAWENRAILHHAEIAESVNAGSSATTLALGQLGAGGYDRRSRWRRSTAWSTSRPTRWRRTTCSCCPRRCSCCCWCSSG